MKKTVLGFVMFWVLILCGNLFAAQKTAVLNVLECDT